MILLLYIDCNINEFEIQSENKCMKDKCLNCPDYPYVIDKNRDKICYRCDFQDAVCELKQAFEESWMYKFMVKLLDWLEDRLEK